MNNTKLKFNFIGNTFTDFVDKLKDLSQISDTVKLVINNEYIFMYSILGSAQLILALKSFKLNTSDYIQGDIEHELSCVSLFTKKLVKSLDFININKPIICDLAYRQYDTNEVINFTIKNDKFKLSLETGEQIEIKSIPLDKLEKLLNLNNREWDFVISADDFSQVYKLSKINSDESRRIINIYTKDNEVILGEKTQQNRLWELSVDNTDMDDIELMFNKSYLNFINQSNEPITFNIFPTFILIENNECKLMIAFEQDFD